MSEEYAIVVCGPQSCGNHLAAEIVRRCMLASDPLRADDGAYERMLAQRLEEKALIIWGALPCGKRAGWSWLGDVLFAVQKRPGARLVIPMRSWPAAAKSAVNHLHVADMAAAHASFQRACRSIFRAVDACPIPFHILSYEGIHEAWALELATLCGFLGVDVPEMRGMRLDYANPGRWDELNRGEVTPNGQC